MIVRDAKVLSEALKPMPEEAALGWLEKQHRDLIFTTAITQAEILYGLEVLPAGKRRTRLQTAVERLFADEFYGRVLPFDVESALVYPKIVAFREQIGRPISQFDAVIASVRRSRRAAIATRNTSDFEDCGLKIINPWRVD